MDPVFLPTFFFLKKDGQQHARVCRSQAIPIVRTKKKENWAFAPGRPSRCNNKISTLARSFLSVLLITAAATTAGPDVFLLFLGGGVGLPGMSPKFINPRSIFSLFLTSKVRLERSRVYIVVVVVVQLLGLYAETGRGRRRIRASVVCEDVLRIGGFISSRSASVCPPVRLSNM